MAEPTDMIMPMLREMRSENAELHAKSQKEFADVKRRLNRIEERQKSFSHALAGDSLMSKMLIGEWEERIEALEKRMKKLEAVK
jgi:polyhydroxyalkanoate synthesis regulator phasin